VAAVFGECQVKLLEVPFTLESARSSFLKVVDKSPPSDKNQQFKDGLIWADCIQLLNSADVYLVTADKAFYEGREYKNNLANNLKLEAEDAKHKIYIFSSLSNLLQEISTEVSLDERALVSQFWTSNLGSIESILERNSFAVAKEPAVSVQKCITEDPGRLYIEFSISYQCEDLSADERSDAVLILKGDGTYLSAEEQFEALRNCGEELLFKTKNGEDKSYRNVMIRASCGVIGHKTVKRTIKYKIEELI